MNNKETILCCIVDDHCDIVPFIHSFYRSRNVLLNCDVTLIHIDAHPDLSIPSANESHQIEDWNDVDTLYEILSEPGGIAEFIFPLVTKHLISQMVWVRSPWCYQLPDGYKKFSIGEYKQQPKVNWQIPYYLDDTSYAKNLQIHSDIHITTCLAENELCWHDSVLKRKDLDVPSSSSNRTKAKRKKIGRKQRWILDICLDYFSTHNPFLDIFRDRFIQDIADKNKIEDCLEVLKEIWTVLPFRNPPYKYSREHCLCTIRTLHNQYNDSNKQIVMDMFGETQSQTVQRFVEEILPLFSVETLNYYLQQGHLLLLPHHPTTETEALRRRITELEYFIENLADLFMRDMNVDDVNGEDDDWLPLFITMARSSSDGYTPAHQVAFLQQETLTMIERVFNRKLRGTKEVEVIIHDLSSDPIQGAYELLLPRQHAQQYLLQPTDELENSDTKQTKGERE